MNKIPASRFKTRRLIALALVCTLAVGPIGCGGPEFVPVLVTTCGVAGTLAHTLHEFQQVKAADLEIQERELRVKGIKDNYPQPYTALTPPPAPAAH